MSEEKNFFRAARAVLTSTASLFGVNSQENGDKDPPEEDHHSDAALGVGGASFFGFGEEEA